MDPTRPRLQDLARDGHAFGLPWSNQVKMPLTGFESSRVEDATRGPWLLSSPFDLSEASLTTLLPETGSWTASFRDGFSTHASSSHEHLSASLGLTVGCPFLSASVSAEYDRTVQNNENGVQASRHSSYRVGRVILDTVPPLSVHAVALLQGPRGETRFRELYGDYYVCAYELGADAGACLSASVESSSLEERVTLTVTVKALFASESVSTTETSSSTSSSSLMTFCGYNTLAPSLPAYTLRGLGGDAQLQLQQTTAAQLAKVATLDQELRGRLGGLGLADGHRLALPACAALCRSGVVVQLLLAPFRRLTEYARLVKA
ncbi:hypothetical protein ASPZODRAFT_147706 [Penicilliopsis zonata CBS 506.65]|uniref:Uncharacterized protein n=1 Tax=Penicilliopsis zonata CBS 506.65 TaxID=1073090 RepID=A0A1L9S4T5_9EURO|nr:hypothetical protein ASPZODRAFT_147706 [Penicilliopsis zonata CBS 506.65]OJJ42179.1 hypothetical protein ASPZODRAFT_147706 [Penicilliopsis zonata CBS 506.65]